MAEFFDAQMRRRICAPELSAERAQPATCGESRSWPKLRVEALSLVTKAGFSFLMAHVKYLEQGHYRVERIEEGGLRDGAVLTMLRPRPVMPGARK